MSDILKLLAHTLLAFELTYSESNSLGRTLFIFTKYTTHWSTLNPVVDEKELNTGKSAVLLVGLSRDRLCFSK